MSGRVFVLGAGASAADTADLPLRLPLANEFFEPAYLVEHWPRDFEKFAQSALGKVLELCFDVDVSNNTVVKRERPVNIEEVYSLIEISQDIYASHLPRQWDPRLFAEARRQLLRYIEFLMRYIPWHLKEPSAHTWIARHLGELDSIITFNWDLLADRALSSAGQEHLLKDQFRLLEPFSFAPIDFVGISHDVEELHRGRFLKLHGSVNLAICTDVACLRHENPFRLAFTEEFPEWLSCSWCGSPLETFLLPPNIYKPYGSNRFLKLQANLAAQKVQLAEEIVILGYSFPFFDFNARSIFRLNRQGPESGLHGNLERVVIVNPSVSNSEYLSMVKELFGLLRSEWTYGHLVEFRTFRTFDEFLVAETRADDS